MGRDHTFMATALLRRLYDAGLDRHYRQLSTGFFEGPVEFDRVLLLQYFRISASACVLWNRSEYHGVWREFEGRHDNADVLDDFWQYLPVARQFLQAEA